METSPTEEIKAKLDIVDYVRETVPLKKAGTNWKACCPFHNEKTPSFMVSSEKQIWHCFGCNDGGDIFEFVMRSEATDFPEALRILAARAGVTLRRLSPEMQSQKTRLSQILEATSAFFVAALRSPSGAQAMEYLKGRGLDDHAIDLFGIGFAPEGWDKLLVHLRGKGFSDGEIEKAGLLVAKKAGGYVDRFRARIMFAIRDYHGNPAGFTGRLLPGDDSPAGKYVNTPSTPLYDKSRVLYNMDLAKHAVKKQDHAIVVEGQMDVISAYQAKTQNVVASSGTALTQPQLDMIGKLSRNLKFAFDSDAAGQDATDRGVEMALAQGFSVKVIEIPGGKDPDDCIRKSPESWYQALKAARPYMEAFVERVLSQHDIAKIEEKKKALEKVLTKVSCIKDPVEREYWLREAAQKFNSSEAALAERLEQLGTKKTWPAPQEKEKTSPPAAGRLPEERVSERLLALALSSPELFALCQTIVAPEHLSPLALADLYKNAVIHYNNETFESFPAWKESFSASLGPEKKEPLSTLDLLFSKDFSSLLESDLLREARSSATLLKNIHSRARLARLHDQIAQAEAKGDQNEISRLTKSFSELSAQLKDLL